MSLREILEAHGVEVRGAGEHRHVRQNWLGVDCPHCSPGWGKFRLGFDITTGRASCWVCGRTDPAEAIALLCRVSVRDAYNLWQKIPHEIHTKAEHKGTLKLPSTGPLLPAHIEYLEDRNFDVEEIQRLWKIEGIGIAPRLQWRIFIPIMDWRGKVVSWTTRSIAENPKMRYMSASEEEEAVPHKSILYGAHLARHAAVIVEGPIDAWGIGPGGVGTCGVGFTDEQKALMANYTVRAVCFDAEPAAQRRAEKLCRELSVMPGVTENVVLESGDDPASADKSEILEIRQKYLL